MTPESAPRDAAILAGQGPFIHRRLGEALELIGLKCWQNEREKTAFVTASPEDRAQMLLMQLQAFDAQRGGGAPPPPQQTAAPVQQVQQAPPATTGAAAAPATGRAPRTPPAATVAAAAGGVGNVVELLNAIKDVGTKLDTLSAAVANGSTAAGLEELKAMVSASMQIQKVEIGLLCLFGEQVLGAGMNDFIGESLTYGDSALKALGDISGKG